MGKVRYKVTKEQLERTVESFVTESTESTKHVNSSVPSESKGQKTTTGGKKKQAPEAKKHTMSMGAEQSNDMGDGMKLAGEVKSNKRSQAPEAKKHVKGSVSESRKEEIRRIMAENNISEEELDEAWWKRTMGDEDEFMSDLKIKARSLKALTGKTLSNDQAKELYNQAKNDGFAGALGVTAKGPEGELVYLDSSTKAGKGPGVTSIAR
jgi:hypothetical protein